MCFAAPASSAWAAFSSTACQAATVNTEIINPSRGRGNDSHPKKKQ
jgi:hypothetical protein